MVDLETLGVESSKPVILSIGAVEFDEQTGELGREFYRVIDVASCQALGMDVEGDTIHWWMGQDDKAKEVFSALRQPVHHVLGAFYLWYPKISPTPLWCNGAAEDSVWLRNAYQLCGTGTPWNFRDVRCFRTLRDLNPRVSVEYEGTAHNALDDARNQARHALAILRQRAA
jgi:oligoribonuclease (3'-5' exoribonuclease)